MRGAARGIPELPTPRLLLRRRVEDDAEALFPSYSDPRAMTYWSHPPHSSVEQTRAVFAEPFDAWRGWAITLKGCDKAIGFVALGEKRQGDVNELGYLLAREHWGAGLASEAVAAVLDLAFGEGQRRVFADVDPDNAASIALLERLGFRREGLLRAEWETHIGVRDSVILGLLRDQWRGSTR